METQFDRRSVKNGKTALLRRTVYGAAAAFAAFSAFSLSAAAMVQNKIPDNFNAVYGNEFSLAQSAGAGVTVKVERPGSVEASNLSGDTDEYTVSVMGVIPVKTVNVRYTKAKYVYPSGESFGIRLYSSGVMVVGLAEIQTGSGSRSPGYEAGLRSGDIITSIDGQSVNENAQITRIIKESGGRTLKIRFTRGKKEYSASLTPCDCADGYKAGLWVRDSVAGIGTMTYYDADNMIFAGLGHGITDSDSKEVYPIASGSAVKAVITSAVKGEAGLPGELKGSFTSERIGDLVANTQTGVYGTLDGLPGTLLGEVQVAYKQEIREGEATVLSSVGDGVKEYRVEIEDINLNSAAKTKNMVIRVTDEKLLNITGGIVQGMSGSPIIQNGKLVGAVTHVFVNDPTRGYAIFAENMTQNEQNLLNNAA